MFLNALSHTILCMCKTILCDTRLGYCLGLLRCVKGRPTSLSAGLGRGGEGEWGGHLLSLSSHFFAIDVHRPLFLYGSSPIHIQVAVVVAEQLPSQFIRCCEPIPSDTGFIINQCPSKFIWMAVA